MLQGNKVSNKAVSFLITFGLVLCLVLQAHAQTLRSTSISGMRDKKGRNPDLGVRVIHQAETVKIVADAHVPDSEISKFPIVFDFFINRKLFATQYRSNALPGDVGVDIGIDVATPPFNYTVVATVQTPNGRNFKTIIDGAVFAADLATTFSECVLSLPDAEKVTETEVTAKQFSNESFDISFEGEGSTTGDTISLESTISLADGDFVTGTLTVTREGSSATQQTYDVTGPAVQNGETNSLVSFTADAPGRATLSCS